MLATSFNVSSAFIKEYLDSKLLETNNVSEGGRPGKAFFSATEEGKSVTLDIKVKVKAITEDGDE